MNPLQKTMTRMALQKAMSHQAEPGLGKAGPDLADADQQMCCPKCEYCGPAEEFEADDTSPPPPPAQSLRNPRGVSRPRPGPPTDDYRED